MVIMINQVILTEKLRIISTLLTSIRSGKNLCHESYEMRAIFINAAKDLRISDCEEERMMPSQVRVKISHGGICGSDLHYFNHGKVGFSKLREPMILGHEVSGFVSDVGEDVGGLAIGDLVAINPAKTCGQCHFCKENRSNQCSSMQFFGSALLFPHIQGAFREEVVVDSNQCFKVRASNPGVAALVEPLSVVLHAIRKSGNVNGRRVLISGAGPIGLIAAALCKFYGAESVSIMDIETYPLSLAQKLGVQNTFDMKNNSLELENYAAAEGNFDLLFECSGAEQALISGMNVLNPGSKIIQLGIAAEFSLPVIQLTSKEYELIGSWRFSGEFSQAVNLLEAGEIDLTPLISHEIPFWDAEKAFLTASNRKEAMKVQLCF